MRRSPRGFANAPFFNRCQRYRALPAMTETTETPTTVSEATDGLAAAALRAEAWAGEPFLREGEDAAQALAPGTSRRRALADARAEIDPGNPCPPPEGKVQPALILALARAPPDQPPLLASGTE